MVDEYIILQAYKEIESILKTHSDYDRDALLAAIILAVMVDENAQRNLYSR